MTADAPKQPHKGVRSDFPTQVDSSAIPTFSQPEAQFLASVIKLARLFGWRWYHTNRSEKSPPGFPDLVLARARHPKPRVVFAELKSERGRLTDAQRAWIEELRACGQEAYIWRPSMWQDVERILK